MKRLSAEYFSTAPQARTTLLKLLTIATKIGPKNCNLRLVASADICNAADKILFYWGTTKQDISLLYQSIE